MSGVEEVKRFINKYGLDAKILYFKNTVRTVEEAAKEARVHPEVIVKTLVLLGDGEPVIAIIPGDKRLDYRKVKAALNVRKVKLADKNTIRKLFNVGIGEMTPLMERVKYVKCIIDKNVTSKDRVIAGGGSLYTLVDVKVNDLIRILKPIITDITK